MRARARERPAWHGGRHFLKADSLPLLSLINKASTCDADEDGEIPRSCPAPVRSRLTDVDPQSAEHDADEAGQLRASPAAGQQPAECR